MVELKRQNKKENDKIYNNTLKKIRKALGNEVPIDHVGSTAIPNMYGKNIIDILIGAKDEDELEKLTKKIKALGFFPGKNSKGMIYRFFANTEEETKSGDIHLHLVIIDSKRYKDFLTLKNYLLSNKEERKKYSDLKKKIIKDGNSIREDYKTIKSKYVTELLERARKYYNN